MGKRAARRGARPVAPSSANAARAGAREAAPVRSRTGAAGRRRRASAAGALLDARGQLLHLLEGLAALGDLVADLLVRVHDGRVVAPAEGLADARQREVGQLAAEVHRDL